MKILFWNTNRNKDINKYIVDLVESYKVDVLVVAEYVADTDELDTLLNQTSQKLQKCMTVGCTRINIWSNYNKIDPATQSKYYSFQIINDAFMICGVHLISNLHGDKSKERAAIIRQIVNEIKQIKEKTSINNIIIIGDLNEMPYEEGCLNADCFHGLPVLNIQDSFSRIVDAQEYEKYYNPMWNFFGDYNNPPGTYYYNTSSLCAPMWYIFDQVLISKSVIPMFVKDELKIITFSKKFNLKDDKGHPNNNISDHFPIICEINDNFKYMKEGLNHEKRI